MLYLLDIIFHCYILKVPYKSVHVRYNISSVTLQSVNIKIQTLHLTTDMFISTSLLLFIFYKLHTFKNTHKNQTQRI